MSTCPGDVPDRGQQQLERDQPLLAVHDVKRPRRARRPVRSVLEHDRAKKVLWPARAVGDSA